MIYIYIQEYNIFLYQNFANNNNNNNNKSNNNNDDDVIIIQSNKRSTISSHKSKANTRISPS